jgi:flavin-binding protein dodecin
MVRRRPTDGLYHVGEPIMGSIVKVTEIIARSDRSFEEAVPNAVTEAGQSIRGIESVSYRVNAKVSFLAEGNQ